MKNTFRKSMALLALVAVIALAFTGCKKDSSSSSGGGGTTPVVPTGNYGTVSVAGQTYNIAVAGYEAYYDEELHQYFVTIFLADRTNIQTANMVELTIVGAQSLPENGTYNYTIQDPMPAGSCGGMFESSQGSLICVDGTLTVSGTTANYTINTSGSATPFGMVGGQEMPFSVHFEGPLMQGR